MIVRGWHFAFDAGTDAALATLHYPGDDRQLEEARLTGRVPALETGAPWPVVVMMPGINVTPDGYRWLAHRLVADGLCVVTYAAIGSLGPAGRGITPGIDMASLAPDTIGTRPSSTVLGPLLARLAHLGKPAERSDSSASGDSPVGSGVIGKPAERSDSSASGDSPVGSGVIGKPAERSDSSASGDSPVAGLLDLERVVVGGHSAGGTVALHNSDPAWVPGLHAVFAYAAHTMTATALGHGEGTVVAVRAKVPVLLLGGTHDGVISASRDRYRAADDDGLHDPVRRTFEEAIGRRSQDSWLIELADAGHFTICWPLDTTSGRSYLEADPSSAGPHVRELLGNLISAFIAASLHRPAATSLSHLVEHPSVHHWDRR